MRLADLKTYWKNAATNNIAIGHIEGVEKRFCSFTAEEALSNLKDMDGTILCLELPQYGLSDALSDNVRLINDGAVLILKKAMQGNNEEISQAVLDTEIVAFEMLTKLKNDRHKAMDAGRSIPEKYIQHLDLNKIRVVDVGPVFDSYYGWRIDFHFNSNIDLSLDESKWFGETKF